MVMKYYWKDVPIVISFFLGLVLCQDLAQNKMRSSVS